MIKRFGRIKDEFGVYMCFRIALMLLALPILAIWGFVESRNPLIAFIVVAGLICGFFLKHRLADAAEHIGKVFLFGGIIYALVLLGGDRLGFEVHTKLLIIAVATVLSFGLTFWSLSDPSVVKAD